MDEKETHMQLWQEISLGRMLLKPVPGTTDDGEGGGCAFGMADAAAGNRLTAERHPWAVKNHNFTTLPCDCKSVHVIGAAMFEILRAEHTNYASAIVHIFNYHVCTVKDWTMDQLIDFVKRVEPPEPSSPIGETGRAESAEEEILVARK